MSRSNGSTYKQESANRRNNKQIMEKKRRARINSCLTELKALVLKGMKKEESEFAKLEKADILEMAVTYLSNRDQRQTSSHSSEGDLARYRAGFNECAKEAFRYISNAPHIHSEIRLRLMEHLADYLQTKRDSVVTSPVDPPHTTLTPVIKREVVSPPLEHTQLSPYSCSNLLPLSPCLDLERCSPLAADTFPASLGYLSFQTLSLQDMQSMTSSRADNTSPDLPEITNSVTDVNSTVVGVPKPKSTTNGQKSMWRPW